jgi:hypothetical protein
VGQIAHSPCVGETALTSTSCVSEKFHQTFPCIFSSLQSHISLFSILLCQQNYHPNTKCHTFQQRTFFVADLCHILLAAITVLRRTTNSLPIQPSAIVSPLPRKNPCPSSGTPPSRNGTPQPKKMIRNVHLIYALNMDALHRVLANGVIAESVPGFVVTDARIMEIDTCVLRSVPALV